LRHPHQADESISDDTRAHGVLRRRPPLALRKVAHGILVIALACTTLEVSARFLLSREVVLERVRGKSDAAWRLDWIKRHGEGVEVYYSFDVFHPSRGWALRPNLRDADPYGPDSLNSNSAGMRGRHEFSKTPLDGKTRILLLGDSFTFGEEVSDSETYAQQLQQLLPNAEILNLGVHGYGHDQMLVYFREEGCHYDPDLVIVGFVQDDMRRNLLEFRDYSKPRFELAKGDLAPRNLSIPAPRDVMAAERYRSRFVDLLEMVYGEILWKLGVNRRRMDAVTSAILDEIVDEGVAVGAVTVFVYLPHSDELTDAEITLDGERFFADYCHQRAAYCLDLRPSFLENIENGLAVKVPGHWHGNGHELVAQKLSTYLVDRALIPR